MIWERTRQVQRLRTELQGRWRRAARAVMALLSLRGFPPSRIPELLDCHPATVRRWIGGSTAKGWPTGRGPDGPGSADAS